jgi:hypothetical protein
MSKVTDVVKEMAKCWGEMGKEARQVYKEAAKKGKLSELTVKTRKGMIGRTENLKVTAKR